MAESLVVKLALNTADSKSQIKNLNNEIKVLKSEFDKANSEIDTFENSNKKLSNQLKFTNDVLEATKNKLKVYEESMKKCANALKDAEKKYGENAKAVNDLKNKLEEAQKTYGKNSKEVKQLKEELKEAENTLTKSSKAVVNADNSLKNMQTTLNKCQTEINQFEKELNDVDKELEQVEQGAKQAGNGINKFNNDVKTGGSNAVDFASKMSMIGQGLLQVGDAVSEAGRKMLEGMGNLIEAGSDYSASIESTNFLIKTLDKATQDWIESTSQGANAIGATEKQFRQMATSIAVYAKNIGLTGDEAIKFSDKVVNLSADLAALADVPIETALSDVKSALVGNFNALDKYAATVSVAVINEGEYAQALGKSWDKMSLNEKSQAILAETMKQTSSATGLAKTEAEAFGMKWKLVKEQIKELCGVIGETLLPLLEPIVKKMSEMVKSFQAWAKENPAIVQSILVVVGVIGGLFAVLGPLISSLGMLTITIGALAPMVTAAGGVIAFLGTTILPVIGVIAGVIAVVVALYMGIKSNFDNIKKAVVDMIEKCRPQFEEFKNVFNEVVRVMKEIYDTVLVPLFHGIGKVVEFCIKYVVTPLLQALLPVFSSVFSAIVSLWDNWLKPVFEGWVWFFTWLSDKVGPYMWIVEEAMTRTFKNVVAPIKFVIDMLKNLFDWIGKCIDFLGKFNSMEKTSASVDRDYSGGMPDNWGRSARTLSLDEASTNTLDNVAKSGSYYNSDTLSSLNLNDTVRSLNSQVQINSSNTQIEQLFSSFADKLVSAIQGVNITTNNTVTLDKKQISDAVYPDFKNKMSREMRLRGAY